MLPWGVGALEPFFVNLDPPNIEGMISSKLGSDYLFDYFFLPPTLLYPGRVSPIYYSSSRIADTLMGCFIASGFLLILDWRSCEPLCILLPGPSLMLAIESIFSYSWLDKEFFETGSVIPLRNYYLFFDWAIKSGRSSSLSTLVFLLLFFLDFSLRTSFFFLDSFTLCRAIIYESCSECSLYFSIRIDLLVFLVAMRAGSDMRIFGFLDRKSVV